MGSKSRPLDLFVSGLKRPAGAAPALGAVLQFVSALAISTETRE